MGGGSRGMGGGSRGMGGGSRGMGGSSRGCEDVGVTRHVFPLKPRWSDLDAYNHVNNVTWLEYLQARVDMLFVHAPARGAEQLAEGVLVARAEIDYKLPMTFRQSRIPSRCGSPRSVRRSSPSGTRSSIPTRRVPALYGVASTVLAPVDLATGRPRRVTAVEREVLERFLE